MPMNVLAVLVFKVRCAPIHQKFHIWTERIEIESGQLAAFGGSSFEEVRWDRTRQIPITGPPKIIVRSL